MAINYDYKKIEIKYNHFHIFYTCQKSRCAEDSGSKNKKIVRYFKILDIFLSLLSSILSILKSFFA